MPTIRNMLTTENSDSRSIRLYSEGIFYKAYEYSAYLFVHYIHHYKLKRRYYKNVKKDIISIGFPKKILAKLACPDGVQPIEKNGMVIISFNQTVKKEDFEKWKANIPMEQTNTNTSVSTSTEKKSISNTKTERESLILEKLSRFNLEGATPM